MNIRNVALSAWFFEIPPQSIDLLPQDFNPVVIATRDGNSKGKFQFLQPMVTPNQTLA